MKLMGNAITNKHRFFNQAKMDKAQLKKELARAQKQANQGAGNTLANIGKGISKYIDGLDPKNFR